MLIKNFKLKYWKKYWVHQGLQLPSLPSPNCSWTYHRIHPEKHHLSSSLRQKWERKWSKLKILFKFPIIIEETHFQALQDLIRFRVATNLKLLEYIKLILGQKSGRYCMRMPVFQELVNTSLIDMKKEIKLENCSVYLHTCQFWYSSYFFCHPAN